MKRLFGLLVFCVTISCHDKVICSAYQSTFILDDNTRNAFFSYAWQLDEDTRTAYFESLKSDSVDIDTTSTRDLALEDQTDYYAYAGKYVVPWKTPKNTKYGVAKPLFYPLRRYQLRRAPMVNVLGPEEVTSDADENLVAASEKDSIQTYTATQDTTAIDTMAVAVASTSIPEETEEVAYLYGYDPGDIFNVEQEYYNKHYGERLVQKPQLPEIEKEKKKKRKKSSKIKADTLSTKKTPFFKRLFNGQKKEKAPKKEKKSKKTSEAIIEEDTTEATPEAQEGNF